MIDFFIGDAKSLLGFEEQRICMLGNKHTTGQTLV
jgi:hypothetical protein